MNSCRAGIWNGNSIEYRKRANPRIKRLVQMLIKHTLEYMEKSLNSGVRSNSSILSCAFPRIAISWGEKVLPTRLLFEVRLIDVLDSYEIRERVYDN